MEWPEITESVIDESIRVHKLLGTGLLKSVYQAVQNPRPGVVLVGWSRGGAEVFYGMARDYWECD